MDRVNILLVVDPQVDFCTGSLANKEAQATVPRITELIRTAAARGYRIVVTKDTHDKDYLYTAEGRVLPVEHCIRNTEGHKIVPEIQAELDAAPYVYVVHKDTFGSVDLPSVIRTIITEENGFSKDAGTMVTVTVAGWDTDVCVVSNVLILRANFPAADIVVAQACCAGVTPEKHEAALETMRSCQIRVI